MVTVASGPCPLLSVIPDVHYLDLKVVIVTRVSDHQWLVSKLYILCTLLIELNFTNPGSVQLRPFIV